MNGEAVRRTWFMDTREGYDASEVDDLLQQVAATLDAGQPVGPLIRNTAFRRGTRRLRGTRRSRRYDIDAVDRFLEDVLQQSEPERAVTISDPWRDLLVAQSGCRMASNDPGSPLDDILNNFDKAGFARECRSAWREFADLPGRSLTWGWGGNARRPSRYEIRTPEQQTMVSREGMFERMTFRAGGRTFTYKKGHVLRRTSEASWSAGLAEAATRSGEDERGRFAAETRSGRTQPARSRIARELVDETGMTLLYESGTNFDGRAHARISFPDQRWLRFLVRGTNRKNSIMTAVDQQGFRVARYRISDLRPRLVEISVNPDWTLTDELVLSFAISARWLSSYFERPGGG